jgi:hypothetical protein
LASSLFSAAQAADVGFEFGLGLATSGDKSDIGEKAYNADSSGLGMFIELQAGVPIGVTDNVVIKPELSYLFSFVTVEGPYADDTYIDSVFIPSVSAEYYVNSHKANSFFVGANIGFPIPSSGSDAYELEKDGISYGIYGGYAFSGNFKAQLGYRSIPVEVVYWDGIYKESANLGGVTFRLAYTF